MEKTKHKIFWTLAGILMTVLVGILGVSFWQNVNFREEMMRRMMRENMTPPPFMRENNFLVASVLQYMIVFMVFSAVILWVAGLLTKWIMRPMEESFQRQKEFIADASHELKTPLAVISASLENYQAEKSKTKWVENVVVETEYMKELVGDLLNLAELEDAPKQHSRNENLSKIITAESLAMESLFFERGLKFESEIVADIFLDCEQKQIKELVRILLDNALEHCKKNGAVRLKLWYERNRVLLEVENSGMGVRTGEKEKIFERFYRQDAARSRSGHYGLGLAIAKRIVENHGGEITAKSENGATKFVAKFNF